jgi:hypothetical protein
MGLWSTFGTFRLPKQGEVLDLEIFRFASQLMTRADECSGQTSRCMYVDGLQRYSVRSDWKWINESGIALKLGCFLGE